MPDLSTVVRGFLDECRIDYVGLWFPLVMLQNAHLADETTGMRATLDMLGPLLASRQISVGQFTREPPGSDPPFIFHIWEMSAEDVIAKIEREWVALGHEPQLGEVAWFVDGPEWVSA